MYYFGQVTIPRCTKKTIILPQEYNLRQAFVDALPSGDWPFFWTHKNGKLIIHNNHESKECTFCFTAPLHTHKTLTLKRVIIPTVTRTK